MFTHISRWQLFLRSLSKYFMWQFNDSTRNSLSSCVKILATSCVAWIFQVACSSWDASVMFQRRHKLFLCYHLWDDWSLELSAINWNKIESEILLWQQNMSESVLAEILGGLFEILRWSKPATTINMPKYFYPWDFVACLLQRHQIRPWVCALSTSSWYHVF